MLMNMAFYCFLLIQQQDAILLDGIQTVVNLSGLRMNDQPKFWDVEKDSKNNSWLSKK